MIIERVLTNTIMSKWFGCCTSRESGGPTKAPAEGAVLEKKIMEYAGLSEGRDFKIYDVMLPKTGGHIHTIEAGWGNQQVAVLVHGYGATGAFYYKMIAKLKKEFHVYAIDMFGFGQSSRPKIKSYEFEKCCQFFVDPIEEWRISLQINDFVLVAHSLGAYIMTQYVRIKRPPIKMLYLVSPAGMTLKSVEEIKDRMAQYVSGFKMLTLKLSFFLMEDLKVSPFHLMFVNKQKALENYFRNERMGMSDDEALLFVEYYKAVLDLPACGETALGTFLFYGCYSQRPLYETLQKLRDDICDVRIFYGDADWMDFEHAIEKNRSRRMQFDLQIVPNAGHQIILQNPAFLCRVMSNDLNNNYDPVVYFETHSAEVLPPELVKYISRHAADLTMMREEEERRAKDRLLQLDRQKEQRNSALVGKKDLLLADPT